MNPINAMAMLTGLLVLSGCKLVTTHVFKLTSTPVIGDTPEVRLSTSQGYLLLPLARLSEQERQLLRSIQPSQCLSVRTSEPFEMRQREVRFSEFKLKKLNQSEPDCRKIKVSTRIYGS